MNISPGTNISVSPNSLYHMASSILRTDYCSYCNTGCYSYLQPEVVECCQIYCWNIIISIHTEALERTLLLAQSHSKPNIFWFKFLFWIQLRTLKTKCFPCFWSLVNWNALQSQY